MGVVLACPPCFLGFGVLLVSCFFLPSCGLVVGGVGGAGCWGFSRVRGWVRPVLAPCGGWGSGASGAPGSCVFVRGLGACAPGSCLPVFWGGGGWVCLCVWFILGMRFPGVGRAARLLCFVRGLGVPGFLIRVRGGFGRVRGGFPGVFVSARRFLPLVWGVSGWVGVVFSPAVLLGPGLFRVRVLVLFGEFDPGSGRTLAACLTHASRTGPRLFLGAG